MLDGDPRVRKRREDRLDAVTKRLERRRKRELLAQVLGVLVNGEAGTERRDLEQHPARLAKIDRAEVEAVDHRCGVAATRDDAVTPFGVVVDRRREGDVVDAARSLEPRLGGRLIVDVEGAALVAA